MPSSSTQIVQRIRHELARRRFDPGGVMGSTARARARRSCIQAAANLLVDGIVGPDRFRAPLGAVPMPAAEDSPAIPWFQEARRLIGVRERVGQRSNPLIIDLGGPGRDRLCGGRHPVVRPVRGPLRRQLLAR